MTTMQPAEGQIYARGQNRFKVEIVYPDHVDTQVLERLKTGRWVATPTRQRIRLATLARMTPIDGTGGPPDQRLVDALAEVARTRHAVNVQSATMERLRARSRRLTLALTEIRQRAGGNHELLRIADSALKGDQA